MKTVLAVRFKHAEYLQICINASKYYPAENMTMEKPTMNEDVFPTV